MPNGLQFSDHQHNLRLWLQPLPKDGADASIFNAPLEDCFGRIPVQEDNKQLKAYLRIPFVDNLQDKNLWGYGPPTTLYIESLGAPKGILEKIVDTWKIPRRLFDAIQKPGSFPPFSFFEEDQNLHIAFRWSSTPGSYLIFLGSTSSVRCMRTHEFTNDVRTVYQFRSVLSHRGVLTPTWNADVMKGGEDVFGRTEYSPSKMVVMMLDQCEKHLESAIQKRAEKVEEIQGLLSSVQAKSPASGDVRPFELYARYRDLTTSLFTLRNSCRNLMEICSGFVAASKTAILSKPSGDSRLFDLKLLRDGIERTHSRLKFHLNRIHYLENIHIQSTKSMAAIKQLLFSDQNR